MSDRDVTEPAVPGGRRDRGALEREVVAALAAADEARTPAQVQADLGAGLAYTTVMTTLSRLHDKGVLRRQRSGRGYAYTLAEPVDAVAEALIAHRMRRLLDQSGDRAVVLSRFVADLDPADEQLLARFLATPARQDTGPEAGRG